MQKVKGTPERSAQNDTADLQSRLAQALAEVLTELVDRRGWTLTRISRATGLSRQTLHNWRDGQINDPRYLGLAKLFALADRSLDLLPRPTGSAATIAHEVRQLVFEQIAQTFTNGLTLELHETRAPVSWQADPVRLEAGVLSVQAALRKRKAAPSRIIRKQTG
jgi:transcriptional regulator with XRE-family HTH domain